MRVQTVKLIEAYYAAFNAGNMQTFLSLLSEGVVHDINQGGSEVGIEAFRRFMDKMNAHYAEQVVDLVVMASEDGRRAAAEFRIQGRYLKTDDGLPPANGQRYDLPVGAFFAVENAKITRVTNYYNLRSWMDAVS